MEFGLKSLEVIESPVQPSVIEWQMKSVAAAMIAGRVVIQQEPASKARIEQRTGSESLRRSIDSGRLDLSSLQKGVRLENICDH